ERFCDPDYAAAERLRHCLVAVLAERHADPIAAAEAVLLDLLERLPEFGQQMRSGHNEVEFERRIVPDQPKDRGHESVVGTAARYGSHAPRHGREPRNSHMRDTTYMSSRSP